MAPLAPLKLGCAYHGNRILSHVREDMLDIVSKNMNLVVHMYTHNDMMRHHNVLKDIISVTEDFGLETWVDNWGIDGGPGDKSLFCSINPDDRMIYSDGSIDPYKPCYNSEKFFEFTKQWLEYVKEAGGKTVFWDEPCMRGNDKSFTCTCPHCRKLFEERYNKPMPMELTDEVVEFRTWSIVNYFTRATAYARELGIVNTVCVMFSPMHGISLDNLDRMASIETLENVGCDPYWSGRCEGLDVYQYVYNRVRQNMGICDKYKKDHNVWVQSYGIRAGHEEEIILATEAAYDAGARTIINWSFRAGESNDYRAAQPDMAWHAVGEANRRVADKHRDAILAEARARYMKA